MSYLRPSFEWRGEAVLGHPCPLLQAQGLTDISWSRLVSPLGPTIKRELLKKTKASKRTLYCLQRIGLVQSLVLQDSSEAED